MKNKKQVIYSIIQFLYFASSAAMFGFASLYLLDKNFTNSQIGLLLALSSVIAIVLQQLIASFVKKTNFNLNRILVYMYIIIALLSLSLFIFKLSGVIFAIVLVIIFFIERGCEPFITAIHSGYKEIEFSVSRAFGSLGYSVGNFAVGQLLAKVASDYLAIVYLASSILLIIFFLMFNAPNVAQEERVKRQDKINLLRDYPHFYMFLLGIMLIYITHAFYNLFLLQIITRINGTTANLGTAAALSAITEMPAMALYKKYYKKMGNRNLLMFAGIMWVVKNILIAIAPNMYFLYAAELLQFFSFSIYIPSTERYLSHVIPANEYLKGQALIASALVIGSLIASLLGGFMIDKCGMNTTLIVMQVFSIVGIVFFIISIKRSLKIAPRVKNS